MKERIGRIASIQTEQPSYNSAEITAGDPVELKILLRQRSLLHASRGPEGIKVLNFRVSITNTMSTLVSMFERV